MQKRILLTIAMLLSLATASLLSQKVDMSLFHGMRPRSIGPAGMSGRVVSIAADPRNYDVFYVGTASGGLWKTTNAGTTFSPIFDNELVASIGALAVDPNRPDIVWAGTGEGNPRNSLTSGRGVYKSLDGGNTWKLMGLEKTSNIHRILINPLNSDIVYVGAIGNPWGPNTERGLYKTSDGGKTWEQILYNGTTVGVCDMVMDPSNPDKLFVGMWNHQRWPYFFNSGGPGSGLYMTLDGGETFTRVTNGIPEETGRIGLAISVNRPDYVYAYVESRPSAIFRSTDGGFRWERRGEQGIGGRPFYYAEIHIDPQNENRLYTIHTGINMSEDGGLTFPYRIAGNVHSDHHAWWINPENPRHIIEGNDGGLAITYDMGQNWTHITNLPLAQFYHINVDMETPYNIYGGLQDNGSWRGPAYKWGSAIINEDWEFLNSGDGFDAMPVPGDPRYCYAQSQGGSLRRVDLHTGGGTSIRPSGDPGERLRFNWNAALAQDPFDSNTIYHGSQFVHKSTNRGDSWVKISPDLSTNDPEKQKTNTSGGITRDATGAEVHCTVITISPSPVQKDVIWAGTDDGNVQVTTDGGKTWTNTTPNIKGAPANSWIPQITASSYNAGEAYVVLNNYRMGDNSAHLYVTKNFGKTWERMIDDTKVWGYVLCFVQDPIEPKLMFAGTEYHLYVSFDGGKIWNKWVNRYPTVSTYDLVIHPKEHDLVIATFGRAVFVLDDIRPLRELAKSSGSILNKKVFACEPPVAIMASSRNNPGYYYRGDAMFEGENRPISAMLTAYVSEDTEERMKVEILSMNDAVIRVMEVAVRKGFNRFAWRFDRDGTPTAGMIQRTTGQEVTGQRGAGAAGGGGGQAGRMGGSGRVLPGTYKVRMSLAGESSTTQITVQNDPRVAPPDIAAATKNLNEAEAYIPKINELNQLYQQFYDCNATITKVDEYVRMDPRIAQELNDVHTPLKEKYTAAERRLSGRPEGLFTKINNYRILTTATRELTAEERSQVAAVNAAITEATTVLNDFLKEWPQYLEKLKEKKVPLDVLIK
jgi:photosystem II stability/assembly factor-like uncharacterized protein